MKKKYLLRILMGVMLCFMFLLSPNSVQASTQNNFSQSQISQQSSTIVWRYKYIDGKLYKRKYNTATDTWIGSWIPA